MSTELPRYEYRLGFRYAANVRSVENSGRDHRTRGKTAALERIQRLQRDSFAATNHHRPTKPDEAGVHPTTSRARPAPSVRSARDLSAISIQRVVRGWRARVWVVQVVHDRAWKALLLIQAMWRGALQHQHHQHHHHHHQQHRHHQHHHHHHHHLHHHQHHQHQCSRKQATGAENPHPLEQQQERCPERAAWEQSWARVRLERPNFRDRVRVWQTISELKRSGGRGRMGVTNSEAWTALHESSGSALVAATRLSSEEYLLGRRLQEHKGKNNVCEVPEYLSLDLASVLLLAAATPSCARTSSEARYAYRGLPTEGEQQRQRRGGGGGGGTFECVSDIFYNVSTTTTTMPTDG
ncbi:unnamed protein product, partial [Laminaria digitata]